MGQQMAVALSSSGIDTTLVTDSAIFALMSRVNKVILGTHAGTLGFLVFFNKKTLCVVVTANGGMISISGSLIVAMAAKRHSTPVVVCAALHKLSPVYPYDTNVFNTCLSPIDIFNFEEGKKLMVDQGTSCFASS